MTKLAAADLLGRGTVEVHGRIAGSSNATLLVTCAIDGCELLAVYKPVAGERELWDFPPGLHRREVAARVLSDWLGWDLVPETVLRDDAPFGEGSLQRVVDEDGVSHYFTLRDDPRWHAVLRRIAAFDALTNNADRKSGHVLLAGDRLWAIDHGLTFHAEPKLRTVIWDFSGDRLDAADRDALGRLIDEPPPEELELLLDDEELHALVRRARALVRTGRLPAPGAGRPYPWPLV
ncbi:MAG TPA: SCO1664 family protein [Acidimicrobiales bacterium]|nr:SCO1664 family protein [Acidimicrobiales bacterium]